MAAEKYNAWGAVVNELKTLNGRLTSIENRLALIEQRQRKVGQRRQYFVSKIKKLQVANQGLRNYIKELEAFLKLPTK